MPMIHCSVEINKPINFTLMFTDRPGRARHILTATTTSSRDFRTGTHSRSNSNEPRAASGTHSPPGHGVFPQTRSRQAWKRHTAMSIEPTSSPGPASETPNTRGCPAATQSFGSLRCPPEQPPQPRSSRRPQTATGTIRRTSAPSRLLSAPDRAIHRVPGASRPPAAPQRGQHPPPAPLPARGPAPPHPQRPKMAAKESRAPLPAGKCAARTRAGCPSCRSEQYRVRKVKPVLCPLSPVLCPLSCVPCPMPACHGSDPRKSDPGRGGPSSAAQAPAGQPREAPERGGCHGDGRRIPVRAGTGPGRGPGVGKMRAGPGEILRGARAALGRANENGPRRWNEPLEERQRGGREQPLVFGVGSGPCPSSDVLTLSQ